MLKKILITISFSTLSLIVFSQQRQIKKQIERLVYVDKKIPKNLNNLVLNVTVYDQKGQEIEYITYGQSFSKSVIHKDSSITRYCGKDYKKIDAVDFMTYDEKGRKVKEETWYYENNQKSRTTGYIILIYNDKDLKSQEISYSKTGNIRSKKTFLYDSKSNNVEIIDSVFNDKDLKSQEIGYSETGSIRSKKTFLYDSKSNNVEIIDSTFNNSDLYKNNYSSINRVQNQFDTLNRISLTSEFVDGELLLRKRYLYNTTYGLETELRYDNDSDTSISSITETIVGYIEEFPYPKKTKEHYWKVINSKIESREKYKYNKDCLLDKIEFYSGTDLTSYYKYEYEFY